MSFEDILNIFNSNNTNPIVFIQVFITRGNTARGLAPDVRLPTPLLIHIRRNVDNAKRAGMSPSNLCLTTHPKVLTVKINSIKALVLGLLYHFTSGPTAIRAFRSTVAVTARNKRSKCQTRIEPGSPPRFGWGWCVGWGGDGAGAIFTQYRIKNNLTNFPGRSGGSKVSWTVKWFW